MKTVLNEVVGDLFTSDAPAIGHGVNNVGVMGAGIAAQFAQRYPEMYADYGVACDAYLAPGTIHTWHDAVTGKHIVNLVTQDQPGPNAMYVWVRQALGGAIDYCIEHGVFELALPRIGCGIGGLKWDMCRQHIERVLDEIRQSDYYTQVHGDRTFTLTIYEYR